MGVKLEAGKSYRTRNGKKAIVTSVNELPQSWNFALAVGRVDERNSDHVIWFGDGSGARNRRGIDLSHLDIVGPWVDPPKEVALTAKVHADGRVEVDASPLEPFDVNKTIVKTQRRGSYNLRYECDARECCGNPTCCTISMT